MSDGFFFFLHCLDLVKFGLIPEFIGRLPVVASVNQLDEAALVQILTEPRNSLVKQYQGLFELGNIKIHFSKAALHCIARQAIEKQTGARGLRRIMVRGNKMAVGSLSAWEFEFSLIMSHLTTLILTPFFSFIVSFTLLFHCLCHCTTSRNRSFWK
jgi:hypothetical protein